MGLESGNHDDGLEHNRQIIATYTRDQLLDFCRSSGVRIGAHGLDEKDLTPAQILEARSDEELRELALAITQGIY